MDLSTFQKIVHEVARRAGGRVIQITEPEITPNFIAAQINLGNRSCHVLCSHDGEWAFSEAIEPALAPLRFTDCPALAHEMESLFGVTPHPRDALQAPFTSWPGLSDHDIRYWKPRTLGDALFNWWD